ncbi:MAG: cobalamin-binding protein [SAR324 cluster bacterium]|nr:cobalamin-binding protein [SAR324 cluster bacterium]
MARPDYAFRTSTHTFFAAPEEGGYRSEPDGHQLRLSLEEQTIPDALLNEELQRAAMAWVIARGGRGLNLNGNKREIAPADLYRLPTGPVKRLVSIAPSNAEIVGALGATHLLVGVESSSDYPPQVLSLPRLGPDLHVDMQALADLQPDLVLASLSVPGMERNITALESLGLPYLVLAPRSLTDIREDMERVGQALGFQEGAARAIGHMDGELQRLRATHGGEPPLRVYLEWWPKPMFSPGRACWSNELIKIAGGRNVFGGLPAQSAEVQVADVVAADPEVIFVSWCGVPMDKLNPERVLKREGLETVSAVREGRVYAVDESLLGRPGPRVVQGITAMAEKLREARRR